MRASSPSRLKPASAESWAPVRSNRRDAMDAWLFGIFDAAHPSIARGVHRKKPSPDSMYSHIYPLTEDAYGAIICRAWDSVDVAIAPDKRTEQLTEAMKRLEPPCGRFKVQCSPLSTYLMCGDVVEPEAAPAPSKGAALQAWVIALTLFGLVTLTLVSGSNYLLRFVVWLTTLAHG